MAHQGSAREVMARHLGALCLSGEGRGRVRFQGRSYPFSYESLQGDKFWKLALSFPFQNPIVLELGEEGLESSIWSRAQKELGFAPQERRKLVDLMRGLGQLVAFVGRVQQGQLSSMGKCAWKAKEKKLLCLVSQKKFSLGLGGRHITLKTLGSKGLQVQLSRFNGRYFQKVSLKTFGKESSKEPGLEFFLNSCQRP